MPDKKENSSRKSKFWPDWSGEKAKVFLLCVVAILALVGFASLFNLVASYLELLGDYFHERADYRQFMACAVIVCGCVCLAIFIYCGLSVNRSTNASIKLLHQMREDDGEFDMRNTILKKNPDREKETEIKKFTDAELETLLGNITADCSGECANCEHSHGTEFECDILPMCAEVLSQLLSEKKRLESEKNDALEMLHAYRHVCVDMTPERVGELTRADKEGRCIILPEEQGKEVR